MYYYILIDKLEKTIQLRPYNECKCDAAVYNKLMEEFNISYMVTCNRFSIFFNGQKDYIDFNTFYKKYNKFTIKE